MLYFETPTQRFELARFTNADYDPIYRIAEVDSPFFKDEAFFAKIDQVPLSVDSGDLSKVLAEDLSWNQFLWGIDSVKVRSDLNKPDELIEIGPILNFLFRPCRHIQKAS